MQNIDQEQFKTFSNTGDYTIIDVRTPSECATGIIPNATNINIMDQADFLNKVQKLDKSKKYLVYCRSGNRSGQACNVMDSLGFTNTNNLVGGMMFWSGQVQ
jgi:rhodanese-related sulfurtransferase